MNKFRFITNWSTETGVRAARVLYIDKDVYYVLVCMCKGKSNGRLVDFKFTAVNSSYLEIDMPYSVDLFKDLEELVYTNMARVLPEIQKTA